MSASRLPLKQLSAVCRSLATTLHAGVPILKAVSLAGGKSTSPALKLALQDIDLQLRNGSTLAEAFRAHDDLFPDLMCDLVGVAEQTGMLPEVFRSLADHYENNQRLRKDFIGQIAWPVVQLIAAICIIAFLIMILGILGSGREVMDPLGFGLKGMAGAMIWLMGWGAVLGGGFVLTRIVLSSPSGQRSVYGFLVRLPVVGKCLEDFAIARFSWAFYLTQESGMPIDKSLDASLRATSNGLFTAAIPGVVRMVRQGETLTDSLAASGLFSNEFIQMVHVGETSGTVPETLHRLSPQFEDQARRSLRALAAVAGWCIWGLVAAFIIFLIFRLAFFYLQQLEQAGAVL